MEGLHNIFTAALSLVLTVILLLILIPFLRRVNYGKTINDIGPTWHEYKTGTPSMGGIAFILAILTASVTGLLMLTAGSGGLAPILQNPAHTRFFAGLAMAFCYAFIGFIDDYIQVVKKRNLGLNEIQKLVLQVAVAAAYLLTLYWGGAGGTVIDIPFVTQIDLGLFYYPAMIFLIVGMVNAVNLTDGVDGLSSSVTFVAALGFMLIAMLLDYQEFVILSTALAAGMIGYLAFNFHPAKVFMGDTGSMFLGGLVVALAFGVGMPLLLLLSGVVYVCEAGSVVLQVLSVKLRRRRIFRMSPIHHHFELLGWSEVKIVTVFSAVAAAGTACAVLAVLHIL